MKKNWKYSLLLIVAVFALTMGIFFVEYVTSVSTGEYITEDEDAVAPDENLLRDIEKRLNQRCNIVLQLDEQCRTCLLYTSRCV